MHREISHTDRPDLAGPPLSLYLLTALVGLLLGADLWPELVKWLGWPSWLSPWSREPFGYQLRLATIAAVVGGARTLYGSLDSLMQGRLGADLALALAAIAALLIGEPVVAAEVVFIGMLGEVLESVTFRRAQRAIHSLTEIFPHRCWVLRDGQEVRVLVSELKPGDRVIVKPGARIPADGIVLAGTSSVDASALTGESLPLEKRPGEAVLAGSLNQLGALTVECRQVGEQTVAGRVLQMTMKALEDKSSGERTADRLARYFLPVVLGLAAITFLVALFSQYGSIPDTSSGVKLGLYDAARLATYPALSVLVVACPCALILATPAAILAAMGRLEGTGILLKGGSALERLAEVDAIAFDKTGTLTEGRLELGDVLPLPGVSPDELLRAAATAEQGSEHLLAHVVLTTARERGLEPEPRDSLQFEAHPGGGVTARSASGVILVGTPRLLEERGIRVPAEAVALLDQLDAGGQTSLLVARDGVVLGAIGARDRVRPEAADVLTELRNLGIGRIALLTGDRRAAAEAVAARVGIDEVHAELLPAQKAEFVERLTIDDRRLSIESSDSGQPDTESRSVNRQSSIVNRQSRVAMVGDGINDAPALARAHVGLGLTGTDVAAEAGDVVLMGEPLRHLPLLLKLSRETVRIIRQNIFVFAFGVNLAGVILTAWLLPIFATGGWYEQSPLVAVLYHQAGSLLVLLNALRLLWYDRPTPAEPTGWRKRMVRVNDWMERNLNLDEWLHGLGHHWKKVLAVVVLLLFAGWGLTGVTQVNADEVGVVRRFGRVLDEDLKPGLHWRWPWPIEDVTRLQARRLRTVEIGFRSLPGQAVRADNRGWASPHTSGIRRYPDESVMITGDGNLIEIMAALHYTVTEPRVYLFEVGDPEALLHGAGEAVLREVVAGRGFTPLLTSRREEFQREVFARLKARCDALAIGVRLERLTLQELHPPPEVVSAYHEVAQAMEEEKRLVNKALADETERLERARAEKQRIDREGESERTRTKLDAEAGRDVFHRRWQARRSLGIERQFLLLLACAEKGKPDQPEAERRTIYEEVRGAELARQAQWSADRLRREVLMRTLPGREMVLIDAPPTVAAYLFALDQLREVLARGILPERPAPPRPRRPGMNEEP